MNTNPEFQAYPSWRYSRDGGSVLVRSASEDAALGDEWADSPAAFADPDAYAATRAETPASGELPKVEAAVEAFPAWRYRRDGESRLVQSQAEADALPGDWRDSPAAFADGPDAPEAEPAAPAAVDLPTDPTPADPPVDPQPVADDSAKGKKKK